MTDPVLDNTLDNTRGITPQELQQRLLRATIAEWVHSGCPASVQRYDASLQQVDVQLLIKDFRRDESGALVVAPVPVLTNLQVGFYSANGYQITTGLDVGTIGWVHFADRSLDRWLAGDGQQVDPEIYSRFNITDGRFVPGGLTFGSPLASAPTDRMMMGQPTKGRIEITTAGTVSITAALAQNLELSSGTGGTVKLNGGGRQVAAQGDTAGPYPIATTGLFVERS